MAADDDDDDDDRGTKAERDGAKADAEAANVEATKARENFMAVVVRMVLEVAVLVHSDRQLLHLLKLLYFTSHLFIHSH